MIIADLSCLFVILRYLPSEYDVRLQVPSTREANSYCETKMASTARFGEEESIDTHFFVFHLHK